MAAPTEDHTHSIPGTHMAAENGFLTPIPGGI